MSEDTTDKATLARITKRIKARARALGFDAVGICDLRPIEPDHLADWLKRGFAGSMGYMHRQAKRRREPATIVEGASRAVVVLRNYFQGDPGDPAEATGRVARYAWGEDYHRVLGESLAALADTLVEQGASPSSTRPYVDAGPVPERELARRAGLGWIAKNTMLIHPRLGSFTFIGSVFTDLALPVDAPFAADHCGSCRRCLDVCPTDAFAAPRSLDARRCISYLTIEHRGPLESSQREMVGDWLFGCDLCQDVCPWNVKFAPETDELRLAARPSLARPSLDSLVRAEGGTFDRLYTDTAFERPGREGLARNAANVIENQRRKEP